MTVPINMTELRHSGETARVFDGFQYGDTNVSFFLIDTPPGELFDRQVQIDIALTTLDHIAFEIPLEHFRAERERPQQLGLELSERIWRGEYAWLGARSLFLDDPNAANEMESS